MNDLTPIPFQHSSSENEIILYQPDGTIRLEVRLEDETVWLNRHQIATLFDRDVKTIGKHIANALKEELEGFPTVANFATIASDGKTYQMEYYNLIVDDAVYHVGASIKDLGKKLFAFSRMDAMNADELIHLLDSVE